MRFDELKGHPEIQQLRDELRKRVDNAADRVLNDTRNLEQYDALRSVGRHDALRELYDELFG